MSNTISNTEDVIDSRDIIERIEELESELNGDYILDATLGIEEIQAMRDDLLILKTFAEECEGYSRDWSYGETLIHRDYFKTYMDDMIADCYELPSDMPAWMSIVLDYYALEQDYSSVDFDGQEFLIRNS